MSTTEPQHEEHADGIVEDREKAPPVYFSILFYGLIVWGVIFMSFYLLSGWSSDAEFQEKMAARKGEPVVKEQVTEPAKPAEPVVAEASETLSGKALYSKHCSACHGPEGKGAFGPDLTGDYAYGKNVMAVQESITFGRPKNMPAFEKKLSKDEIESLTEYILQL